MKFLRPLLASLLLTAASFSFAEERVGVKTNLISDGFLSPNLGVEIGLAPHWSLDLTGQICFWDINKHKWKHWMAQPEARYWFCDRFAGHFLGVHAIGGKFNFGNIRNKIHFLGSDFSQLTDYRYQGWAAGGGIAYGYAWILSKHWNLEAEIGIGWMYTKFDKFSCMDCGRKVASGQHHNYFGPTKLAINLEYIF